MAEQVKQSASTTPCSQAFDVVANQRDALFPRSTLCPASADVYRRMSEARLIVTPFRPLGADPPVPHGW